MICAAKRVQKSTILTIACCSMPSPGGYCDWDPIGRKRGRVWPAEYQAMQCVGNDYRLHRNTARTPVNPKGRAKFDERDDGSPQPQIPADLGCACGNLYGKMLES